MESEHDEHEISQKARLEAFRMWINKICDVTKLDYSGVARKAGLSPSTITRPLNTESYGGEISPRTIGAIANVFRVRPPSYLEDFASIAAGSLLLSRQRNRSARVASDAPPDEVDKLWAIEKGTFLPIYGTRLLGMGPLRFDQRVSLTPTPPELVKSLEAFAVYCYVQPMKPAIKEGSILLVDPTSPMRSGDYIVLCLQEDDEILVRELVAENANQYVVRAYEGDETEPVVVSHDDLQWVYKVVQIKLP